MNDPLLDKMVGHWTLSGTMVGRPATHDVDVEWVMNHQFLRIHEVDKAGGYEAMPMIGYDNTSERYVAHWIDVFGGRWSETLGSASATATRWSSPSNIPTARSEPRSAGTASNGIGP